MGAQTDSYHQKRVSLTSKSKQDFIREYKNYDEASARGVYIDALNELSRTIADGNVESFEKLSNLVQHIGDVKSPTTLRDYYNNSSNPIRSTNLVILACKHNRVEILLNVFSNNSRILDELSIRVGNEAIAPNDTDETCHDAFYYAIRSGSAKLLDTLIDKWPGDYFAARSGELDEVLSKSYEDLKLNNVPLSDAMEVLVETKLLDLRFFSYSPRQTPSHKPDADNIRDRVNLVLESIGLLKADYLNEKPVDGKFLLIAKFIAQNIHVLKRQLRSTYARLPWEEMEFCLISFVSCHVKRQEINLFYRSTINKSRIVKHLDNFANKLENEKYIIKRESIDKLCQLPNLKRETVVAEILSECPQFTELYRDHQQIRDINSLEKINDHIKLASSADPKERAGRLIITRALQVIGENVKNTLESPKLSSTTSERLLLSIPENTRQIIVDLRNSLSHSHSLARRREIEKNEDVAFFLGLQNDTRKVGAVVSNFFYNNKIKIFKILLEEILNSDNLDEIKELASVLPRDASLDEVIRENFKMMEHEYLCKLVKALSDNITDKTNYENEMFNKITLAINSAEERYRNTERDYIAGYTLLSNFIVRLGGNTPLNRQFIKDMKIHINRALEHMTPKIDANTAAEIALLTANIYDSLAARIQYDDSFDEVVRLYLEICFIVEFGGTDFKFFERFKYKLTEKTAQRKACNSTAETYNDQLELKLSELKGILSNSNETLYKEYKNDRKLQAVVEMLVLDIMSILGSSNDYLLNNLLCLDDTIPLLTGKCLRNHLAHDNALVDVLLADPVVIVLLNAQKLSENEANIMRSEMKIGKLVQDNPFKLLAKHNQALARITLRERMFIALEQGNLENFKDCLQQGADINARSINSWTTLHFAAKGSSLDAVQFILEQGVTSLNERDIDGQSPLHVAAAHGRTHTVEFLVKHTALHVDDLDNMNRTPLHMATENRYRDTVEVLLDNKANAAIQDTAGFSPFFYAIINNDTDMATLLLAREGNADINEAMGGLTPLHTAAGFGYPDLVNFLLQNGADSDASIDGDTTPLHVAASLGHLDVVKALILRGANVNARAIDGMTPLHEAVKNGHEELVNTLLRHEANVNAASKVTNSTPLHCAARSGCVRIVNMLLRNNANVSMCTANGLTALHLAACRNHFEIVTALLEHGASVDCKNKYRATPLHGAAQNGHAKVAELLIQCGADVNAKADKDCTPLHAATLKGFTALAALLIRNKARVEARDIEGNTPLHTAAMNGSRDTIELLIRNKSEVNTRNHKGLTPLHMAAVNARSDAIVILMANKAEVNASANGGCTPLFSAVVGPRKDVVESNNVNVTSKDQTPLQAAIKFKHKDIVELLIANGANVNTGGEDPLYIAVLGGYSEIVGMLLQNIADANAKYPGEVTLLHLAAGRGNGEIVKALIKHGADVDAVATNNVTPLYVAAHAGYEEVVEILIKNGASLNVVSVEGSALHIAAGCGHVGVAQALLNNGADVNIKDGQNRTPLQLAVACGQLHVVKMLFRCYNKVDAEIRDHANRSILHIASQESNLEMVKYIVAESADINARNAFSAKPIHIAAGEGHKHIVEFFLKKGQTVDERDAADSQTLLHYAAARGRLEVVSYLIQLGADANAQDGAGRRPIHLAAMFGCVDVIEVLLKNGAVYNAVDKLNKRPLEMARDKNTINLLASTENLFKAVGQNCSSKVASCLKAGAFVNASDGKWGFTPLLYAAWKGSEAVVHVLLQNKADPNAAVNNGITSLHYAAKFSHLNMAKSLLANGAIYNSVCDSGETPSDLAGAGGGVTSLLRLVSASFEHIEQNNSNVINDLSAIKDIDTIKAVMGARNRANQTLIAAAVLSGFSQIEQLKQISQGDVSSQIAEALKLSNQHHQHQQALRIFQNIFHRRKEILGPDNPGTLDIQAHIASVLQAQGFFEEALNTLKEICHKQREILGLNNPYTLETRAMIAIILHRQGQNEEALHIFREVYRKQAELLGTNHLCTLHTQSHMALALNGLGKYEEALTICKKTFEKYVEIYGANHPETLSVRNNAAMALANQGKYDEALQICRDVFEMTKQALGFNHSNTLIAWQSIAAVLLKQQKYQEALQTNRELLSIQENVLGPNHPDTAITQYNMANALYGQGKFFAALKAYRKCSVRMKSNFVSSHPLVLDISKKLESVKQLLMISNFKDCEIIQYFTKEIHTAATKGDAQTIQRLIKEGADVNDTDLDGRAPLHYAVNSRRRDIINILLKAGADITLATNKGSTPLHTATKKGCPEIVEVLLQHVHHDMLHDYVNAKTFASSAAALHVAAESGNWAIVKLLLQHGAMYDMKNREGKMSLDLCKDSNVTNLLMLIEDLFGDAKTGSIEIVSKLEAAAAAEFLAVTNARNYQGNTILQVAIINKHKNIASKLIELIRNK